MENLLPCASIMVPTKNGGERLGLVLKAIFNSKVDFKYEVIVVDSGSTDGTLKILSKYPIKLIEIESSRFSHGRARNLAAENANGKFLVFLSQDAVPKDEFWLSNLLKNFNDESVAGVYGRQIPEDKASYLEKFFLSHVYSDAKTVKGSLDPDNCLLCDFFFSNVNSAMRRSDWERFKFNETLVMSEDQEWARRILINGKKIVYEPDAVVMHSHDYTIPGLIARNFDSGMSLRGLVRAPLKKRICYEMGYLRSGIRFFLKKRAYRPLFAFPFYEGARLLGFLLGHYSDILPIRIKKLLSQNKRYWSENEPDERKNI